MHVKGNTILITGAGSGIGCELAKEFYRRGNRIIIAGRHASSLDAVARICPGIVTAELDVKDEMDIARFAAKITHDYPQLNVLINNAGIMQHEDWCAHEVDIKVAEETIATNLLGPIRLTAALLPLLRKNTESAILNVSSGLAFLPLAHTPTYSASKAALHSFTESLRYQLKDTGVDVIEIIPPYVQTELMGVQQASDPHAMPLAEFIIELMSILESRHNIPEVLVQRVLPLRFAAEQGFESYTKQFTNFNDHFSTQ